MVWEAVCIWAHSRLATFGVHRSEKAHQRVDLSQSIQLPSLIKVEERAIVRAIGTHDRFAPVVRAPTGDPGSRTWQPILVATETTPGKRKRPSSGVWASPRHPYMAHLLPCLSCPFRIRDRTARVGWESSDRHGGLTTDPAPLEGHLCGWPEHHYCGRRTAKPKCDQ